MSHHSTNNVYDRDKKLKIAPSYWGSSFSISEGDMGSDRLFLKDGPIVGRSTQVGLLQNCCSRIQKFRAQPELVLCYGESGCGKTTLVTYVMKTKKQVRELWCVGKFGQYAAQPYSAFIDATHELCTAIQSSLYAGKIKSAILQEFTMEEMQELSSVFPSTRVFLQEAQIRSNALEPVKSNANSFAFKRLAYLYRRFLDVVASDYHPLIVFLDDLQWADSSSAVLLTKILQDGSLKNMLIIGGIRTGPDEKAFVVPQECSFRQTTIELSNFLKDDVNTLLALATRRGDNETKELASIVFTKTQGNPLYVAQYVEMLYREELIFPLLSSDQFEWDLEAVLSRTNVTENLVTLLTERIARQPVAAQLVLIAGGCLGFTFDAIVLDFIFESIEPISLLPESAESKSLTSQEIRKALRECVRAALLETLGDTDKYKFSHDKLRQMAIEMLPQGEQRRNIHLQFANILLKLKDRTAESDWMLFSAVDTFLKYESDEVANSRGNQISEMCLQAALLATKRAAFQESVNYGEAGLRHLGEDAWQRNYDFALSASNLLGESYLNLGEIKQCHRVAESIACNTKRPEDRYLAQTISVRILERQSEWTACSDEIRLLLRQLGVRLPVRATVFHVITRLLKIRKLLKGHNASYFESCPPASDATVKHALHLLSADAIASYMIEDEMLHSLVCLEMMLLVLENGVSYGEALAAYGIALAHLGELQRSFEFADVAYKLMQRPNMSDILPICSLAIFSFNWFLCKPMKECPPPLRKAYEVGMSIGDITKALFCAGSAIGIELFCTDSLTRLETFVLRSYKAAKEYKQDDRMKQVGSWGQLVLNLLGKAPNPLKLTGSLIDENMFDYEQIHGSLIRVSFFPAKMILLCTLGDFEQADRDRLLFKKHAKQLNSTPFFKFYILFYSALSCLVMARKGRKVSHYKREAGRYMREMEPAYKFGCSLSVAMMTFLKAELSVLSRKSSIDTVMKAYLVAVEESAEFPLLKGLALERAGEYQLFECRNKGSAKHYLRQSYGVFESYSAIAKIEQMRKKYSETIKLPLSQKSPDVTASEESALPLKQF